MGAKTSIEWTDASWTPIRARAWEQSGDGVVKERIGWHCEKVSAGCKNCYAEPINRRLGTGLDYKPSHLMRADVSVFLDETMLLAPLKWRKARRIFVCSMTDLFADFVTDEMIDRVFAVMALCPQHTFQVLTKRPERMRAYFAAIAADPDRDARSKLAIAGLGGALLASLEAAARMDRGPLPNVWLGVSVEDQEAADARIPHLLATPATVRFLSCEPLLGPVDLTAIPKMLRGGMLDVNALTGVESMTPLEPDLCRGSRVGWVIVGGESGHGARPMHPDWARSLRDQCAAAGVAFHFKQWGQWASVGATFLDVGKKAAGRLLDGVTHDGMPA